MPNESEIRLGQGEGHECNTRQLGPIRLYLTSPICQFQLSVKKIKFIYWAEETPIQLLGLNLQTWEAFLQVVSKSFINFMQNFEKVFYHRTIQRKKVLKCTGTLLFA